MNSLALQAGKNLKRSIEAAGREPTLLHYLVAAWLKAQDDGVVVGDMIVMLQQVANFDGEVTRISKDQALRELGF